MIHLDDNYLRVEIIQIKANRVGKLRMANIFFNANDMAAELHYIFYNSDVAGIVRVGPDKSFKLHVLKCVFEVPAFHIYYVQWFGINEKAKRPKLGLFPP